MLDEPTAALDPAERASLLGALDEIRRKVTLLVTTHNTNELPAVCDDVVVLERGRIIFSGALNDFRQLVERPEDPDALDRAYMTVVTQSA
jgi:ABC-2 type transport system ATP-binding protein